MAYLPVTCRTPLIFIYKYDKYTDTQMGSKTISIKDDTYHRLDRLKGTDESFSDVIDRLMDHDAGETPLAGLIDMLDTEEAAALRDRSRAYRRAMDERMGQPSDAA